MEAGLHYNWHRHYDPTLGRYTQPDPLGFVDGPSVYGYARGAPHRFVDRDGRNAQALLLLRCAASPVALATCIIPPILAICMANKPPGYWNGPDGAEEWGRRNNVPPKEARRKFHDVKKGDKDSRPKDDYYVNPETGDVVGPTGESAGNLGD